mmetsp:Transcript_5958/g.19244  ORF Transcript_5958/g.19244 Transcript_5958/m.19244 type:complete len:210 (+) Transcript_5958:2022-2651(+)
MELAARRSKDALRVTLPTMRLTVTDKTPLPRAMVPARPTELESEIQMVCCAAVIPMRIAADVEYKPSACPCTVTKADPERGMLARCCTLTEGRETETTRVCEPEKLPTVIETRRLLPRLEDEWQETEVEESHSIASHAVLPTRASAEKSAWDDINLPFRITTAEPVDTRLAAFTPLNAATSEETDCVMVPTCKLAVSITFADFRERAAR